MGSSVQTFQCFALPSKHQSSSRGIINCSHPLHEFLQTLFGNFTEGMSVLSLHCNEKWLRNVWTWEYSISKNSSSHRGRAVSRKTWKITKADYSCAPKSLPRPGTVQSHSQGKHKETFPSKDRDKGSNLTGKQITCILLLQTLLWGGKKHIEEMKETQAASRALPSLILVILLLSHPQSHP